MKISQISPIYGLIGCAFFWAINAIIAREYRFISNPFDLNFFRWLFALIILTPFAYQSVLKNLTVIKSNFFKLTIFSILAVSFFNSFQYFGGESTSAINLGLINSMNPILTMIFSWFILKQKPTLWMFFGIIISFFGVSLVILKDGFFVLDWLNFRIGDLWMFLAVICWAFYSVLLKFWSIKIAPISFLWVSIFLGTIMTPILKSLLYLDISLILPEFHLELFWVYLFISIFPSILAYLFWNCGVRAYGPSIAALFIYISPCFIALISFFLLEANLTIYHLIGGILIFIGFCSIFLKKIKHKKCTYPKK